MVAFSRFCAFALVAAQAAVAQTDNDTTTTVPENGTEITTTVDVNGSNITVTTTDPADETTTTVGGNSSSSSSTTEASNSSSSSSTAASSTDSSNSSTAASTTAEETTTAAETTTTEAGNSTTTAEAAEKEIVTTELTLTSEVGETAARAFCDQTDSAANALAGNIAVLAIQAGCEAKFQATAGTTCAVSDKAKWFPWTQCSKSSYGITGGETNLYKKTECADVSTDCTAQFGTRRRLTAFSSTVTQAADVEIQVPAAAYVAADITASVADTTEWSQKIKQKAAEIQTTIENGGNLESLIGGGFKLAELVGEEKTATGVNIASLQAELAKVPLANITVTGIAATPAVRVTTKAPSTSSAHAVGGSVLIGASVAFLVLA